MAFGMGAGNMVVNDPGAIVGPLSAIFGTILNFIFEFVHTFMHFNVLGVSIILLTIFTRIIMIPLAIKMQKSFAGMRVVGPEMQAIKKKYDGVAKTRESQQKMNAEIQALYAKHKINPFGGCLPLLVQMPIFISLNFIMQQSYRYVGQIGDAFNQISEQIIGLYDIMGREAYMAFAERHFIPKIPNNMDLANFNMGVPADIERIVSRFTPEEWYSFIADMPAQTQEYMYYLVSQKDALEVFFGINLSQGAGIGFPGIFIPILAAVTTFLSSYYMMKLTGSATMDEKQAQMQKMMLYMMPLMIGFFTVQMAAGVGLYWITSSAFQFVQQLLLNKYYTPPAAKAAK